MQLSDNQNTVNDPLADVYAEEKLTPERKRRTRTRVRCAKCAKLLAEVITTPWKIQCYRCKAVNIGRSDDK